MSKYYTTQHEYIIVNGSEGVVGISDFAQSQLGDVVYAELPEIGRQVSAGDEVAVVESVKAASEVYSPVAGEVVAVNSALDSTPGTINEDPEGNGWFLKIKIKDASELSSLMDASAYETFLKNA